MSHVRRQIREAAAAALAGLATTGTRVFQSRLHPLRDADLPCLLVNTDDEEIDTIGIGLHATQERQLALKVRAVAKDSSDLDDTLDQMLVEIESAMGVTTLGGIAKGVVLRGISIEMNDELEKPVGVATASYQITYYTDAGLPGSAI